VILAIVVFIKIFGGRLKMNDLVLSRIVCDQKLTRKRYTWWSYVIKNDRISIQPLKTEMPSFDSLLLAIIRDAEFNINYLSNKFFLEEITAYAEVKDGYKHYYIKDETPIKLNVLLEIGTNNILIPIINLPVKYLIAILSCEYPHLFELSINAKIEHYKLRLGPEGNRDHWRNDYRKTFREFKDMNVGNIGEYIIVRFFGGLKLKDNSIKLYPYNLCYDWHEQRKSGGNFYDYLQKHHSSKFRKVYMLFYKNGYTLNTKMNRKSLKEIKDIFIKNKYLFN